MDVVLNSRELMVLTRGRIRSPALGFTPVRDVGPRNGLFGMTAPFRFGASWRETYLRRLIAGGRKVCGDRADGGTEGFPQAPGRERRARWKDCKRVEDLSHRAPRRGDGGGGGGGSHPKGCCQAKPLPSQAGRGRPRVRVRGLFSDFLFQPWLCAVGVLRPEWLRVENVDRRYPPPPSPSLRRAQRMTDLNRSISSRLFFAPHPKSKRTHKPIL